jgi:hypothetical protein
MNKTESQQVDLKESYQIVGKSIVAIAIKRPSQQPSQDCPIIIGTGFVVADGLVATNHHVVRQAEQLQALPEMVQGEWPVMAVLFHLLPGKGMCQLEMEVLGAFVVEVFEPGGYYYGPEKPDLGFFHINMRGLPSLSVCAELEGIVPGTQVATAGFPMGTTALRAPGYVHQVTPTLQQGIVSAVLPFPCKNPHALMLNLMSQGGASGSPIFLPDRPDVVGVLYGGLQETYRAQVQGGDVPYNVPTNFTYCVAGHYLQAALANITKQPELQLTDSSPHFDKAMEQARQFQVPPAPAAKGSIQ